MDTITAEQLSRTSRHVLDRVQRGELLEVTRNGTLVAMIVPAGVASVPAYDLRSGELLSPDCDPRRRGPAYERPERADVRIVCPDCGGIEDPFSPCRLCGGAGIVLATAAPDPPPFDSYGPEHPRPDREDS
jgi:prevent-host-death family protein